MSAERAMPRSGSADLEAELREEFELHLDLLAECERQRGASEEQAAAAALRRFGNPDRHAAACRRLMQGDWPMSKKVLVAWNVALTIGLVFTFVVASRMMWRGGPGASPEEQRAGLLRSIWRGEDSGLVRVEGKVARPGAYPTSTTQPMTLAQLFAQAGGVSPDAKIVAMRDPELECEGYTTVKAAMRPGDDPNRMPMPGTIVTVK